MTVPNASGMPSFDIRQQRFDAWSVPEALNAGINTAADETRPFLTWDRLTLFFGRAPGTESPASDIFLATREKITGNRK